MARMHFRMMEQLPRKGPLRFMAARVPLGVLGYAGLAIATGAISVSPMFFFMRDAGTTRWIATGVSVVLWLAIFFRVLWNVRKFRRATGRISFDHLFVLIALLVWGGIATALLIAVV